MKLWRTTAVLLCSALVLGYCVTSPIRVAGANAQTTETVTRNTTKYLSQAPSFGWNVQVQLSRPIGVFDYVIASYVKNSHRCTSEIVGRRTGNGSWDEVGMISTLPHDNNLPVETLNITMPKNTTMIGGLVNSKSIKTVRLVFKTGRVVNVSVTKTGAYVYIADTTTREPLQVVKVEGYNSKGHLVYASHRSQDLK